MTPVVVPGRYLEQGMRSVRKAKFDTTVPTVGNKHPGIHMLHTFYPCLANQSCPL